jgi:hypothetical protein
MCKPLAVVLPHRTSAGEVGIGIEATEKNIPNGESRVAVRISNIAL